MNERRKGRLRRQLADRRIRGERRMQLQRLFNREGWSGEDIRRNATEWWVKLDRRYRADRRSGTDRRQQPDRRSI